MLNIFGWLPVGIRTWMQGRSENTATATELYGSIVTQARLPIFYTAYGVLDVAEKRYEMIVLHIVLVLERVRASGDAGMEVGRELVEVFVRDLDGSIREMAIGDTKVPNNVKKAAAGLLDRDVLYRHAFDVAPEDVISPDDMTLNALLDELFFDGREAPEGAKLARYIEDTRDVLSGWRLSEGAKGLAFAKPEAQGAE